MGWKINVLDSCDQGGSSSDIDEIYVQPDQPDQPDQLQPEQSIRHETKVKPNDIYLLQNERKIDVDGPISNRKINIETRDDKNNNLEFTKMIANGILAAEALENSLKNKTKYNNDAKPLLNHHGEPIISSEPLPMYLTPPKSFIDKPFRYEHRVPMIREKNNSNPYIIPSMHTANNNNNHFKHYNLQPIRKNFNEHAKVTKILMPPLSLRRDYVANSKPIPQFPVHNKPLSLQKHLLRGPPASYVMKQNFHSPMKITKKEFIVPFAQNVGFQPDSVVVESGFTPISRRYYENHYTENDFDESADESDDYPDQKQRRSDNTDVKDTSEEIDKSELLIKTFEPMFIPSPLDSSNGSATKGDLQYMEMEEGEDKMAMAGERHAYYLPPEVDEDKSINFFFHHFIRISLITIIYFFFSR